VEAVGNKFTCYFDGDKKIEATAETFKDAGRLACGQRRIRSRSLMT
jgi:hypothetical protein